MKDSSSSPGAIGSREEFEERLSRIQKIRDEVPTPKSLTGKSAEQMAQLVWHQVREFAKMSLEDPAEEAIDVATAVILLADVIAAVELESRQLTMDRRHAALQALVFQCDHGSVTSAIKLALEKFAKRLILTPTPGDQPSISLMTATADFSPVAQQRPLIPCDREVSGSEDQKVNWPSVEKLRWTLAIPNHLFIALASEGSRQSAGLPAVFRRLRPLVKFDGTESQWLMLLSAATTPSTK